MLRGARNGATEGGGRCHDLTVWDNPSRMALRRRRQGVLDLDIFAKLVFKEFVCFPVTTAVALRALWLHLYASDPQSRYY